MHIKWLKQKRRKPRTVRRSTMIRSTMTRSTMIRKWEAVSWRYRTTKARDIPVFVTQQEDGKGPLRLILHRSHLLPISHIPIWQDDKPSRRLRLSCRLRYIWEDALLVMPDMQDECIKDWPHHEKYACIGRQQHHWGTAWHGGRTSKVGRILQMLNLKKGCRNWMRGRNLMSQGHHTTVKPERRRKKHSSKPFTLWL